jgi:peptidoglycan-associated lipoprotein
VEYLLEKRGPICTADKALETADRRLIISPRVPIRYWTMKKLLTLCVAALLVAGFDACKKKSGDVYAGIEGDYVTGTPLPDRIEGANFFGSNVTRGQFSPVYFAYDSFSISGSELDKVQQVASAMKSMSQTLVIAGFTDERGTEEYNRGLGEKRAQTVRDALISRGVSGGRIQTVSFGEEMPAEPANNESAWAKNRRAEFGVVK